MDLKGLKVTWLGHSTFLYETPEKKKILVDPWLAGNPKCPKEFHNLVPDGILITHGHGDHIGNIWDIHAQCEGPIVGIYDLTSWLGTRGVAASKLVGMNKGGNLTLPALNVTIAMTDARHSSSFTDDNGQVIYLGEPAGYVLKFSNGITVYHAGDTALFGDMALIAELYQPDIAVLPIGDHFTMDPKAAAYAYKLLRVKAAIPCHYGTFPQLTGTVEGFRACLNELGLPNKPEVLSTNPGQTIS